MVHWIIPDGYEFIVGIILLVIATPIFLYKFHLIKIKNPFKKKKLYGKRYGYEEPDNE